MKKLLASLMMIAALAGPLAPTASATPNGCKLAEKLGVVFIKECGNDW